MHLRDMMIDMKMQRNPDAISHAAVAPRACLISAMGLKANLEVLMSKTLTVVMAAALVAALFVGATVTAKDGVQVGRSDYQQGIMPEVVVKAEMPRLVMPTVQARAFRTLAMTGSGFNVN
jgi:hypothetical protein